MLSKIFKEAIKQGERYIIKYDEIIRRESCNFIVICIIVRYKKFWIFENIPKTFFINNY